MSALADKIRKSRESLVPAGEFTFTIRRPTDVDMMEYSRNPVPAKLLKFVVGWEGVKELDIITTGDGHPAPFDSDACAEWLADRSDLFVIVVNAVIESYQSHKAKIESAAKN